MDRNLLKGILFVGIGAASYGVLATLVRLAYNQGYSVTEVTYAQYLVGLVVMGCLWLFRKPSPAPQPARERNDVLKLIAGGTSYGLTGVFYYLSVQYIPVSICVILLMQTIWMGVVLESLLAARWPGLNKIIAVIVVLLGTVLATNVLSAHGSPSAIGVLWGLAAAVMYTISLYVSNSVATGMPSEKKGFFILLGGTVMVVAVGLFNMPPQFQLSIFWTWGLLLALFGTILPPLLFNVGFPKTGIGLGAIIIAIEIPVSVSMAWLLLHERVNGWQWFGIVLIIVSIILMNIHLLRKELARAKA
ncbi:DMT family transporter [Chitinophaga lutea]|uniref:DMT family transporter n=1 Tax=Chitinophaga lutea TaxID=2488634 RepID=A0A3N4PI13_9BACT|nr:DMT family transporter [Chitinophaga lutea]RPE08323.1 DMT family transporter [Chitinophaga lutea]